MITETIVSSHRKQIDSVSKAQEIVILESK